MTNLGAVGLTNRASLRELPGQPLLRHPDFIPINQRCLAFKPRFVHFKRVDPVPSAIHSCLLVAREARSRHPHHYCVFNPQAPAFPAFPLLFSSSRPIKQTSDLRSTQLSHISTLTKSAKMSGNGYTYKSSGSNNQVRNHEFRPLCSRYLEVKPVDRGEEESLTDSATGQPLLLPRLRQRVQLVPLL